MTGPYIASPWVRIVEDPARRLLDCCVFRGPARTWHCIGALAGLGNPAGQAPAGGAFFHCTGRDIAGPMTRNPDITLAMPADPDTADAPAGAPLRSPRVVFDGRGFHLLCVQGDGRVLHARSGDPNRWGSPAVEAFADTQVAGPGVIRVRNLWCMYYCQVRPVKGEARSCVVMRTSLHLTQWSQPKVVYVYDADTGPAESQAAANLAAPALFRGPGGFYLLLGRARPGGEGPAIAPAEVFFSQRHDRFAWGDKSRLAELPAIGAPAVFEAGGGLYLARIATTSDSPGSAVEVARLRFDDA